MNPSRKTAVILALGVAMFILWVGCMLFGSVRIPPGEVCSILLGRGSANPSWEVIIMMSRLPSAVAAMLAGAALSLAGLQLQTTFNNPLAGPSILGVSTGASLGVAVVMLAFGGSLGMGVAGVYASITGAFAGSMLVLAVLLGFSRMVRSTTMLLIVGIIVGYLASSVISLLNFFSTQEGVHSFVIWGMGSFNGVTLQRLALFAPVTVAAIACSFLLIKPLDALLLGENYARNLGVDVRRVRGVLLAVSGLLTAVVTAFCGPIAFVGLIVPHLARLLLRTSAHSWLLGGTALCGGCIALLCQLLSALPSTGIIPINAITPIIGAPIILYIIVNRHKIFYLQ